MTKQFPIKVGPAKDYSDVLHRPDETPELTPDLEEKINKLIEFFGQSGIQYNKFKPEKLKENKKAYPNYDQYMYIPGQHNIAKWMDAVKKIYEMEVNKQPRIQSIHAVTAGWKPMETYDFLNWLRYYEEGNHLKYKMAQLWYENGAPGYFLHVKPDKPKEDENTSGDQIDFARDSAIANNEKRQVIEKQRNKIIGRLDSAEKLLRSVDGHTFAGDELEALMDAVFQLKKKIQLVNKMSTSTRLYDDMIVREANILHRSGFVKASEWLYNQAQANNPPPKHIGTKGPVKKLPPAQPPESPSAPLHPGAPGGLPSMGPGMSQNAPAPTGVPEAGPNDNSPTNLQGASPSDVPTSGEIPSSPIPQEEPVPEGISDFLDRMNGNETDDLEVNDIEDDLFVEAQALDPITTNPAPASRKAPDTPPTQSPRVSETIKDEPDEPANELEVSENDAPATNPEATTDTSVFDAKIDAAFADVTIADIVDKLENIANIFRTRELARQLTVVDFMLDALNMSSLFPSLSEAINKNLDANQYCLTRLEDILSRLRGAMPTKDVDIQGQPNIQKPEVAAIKSKLETDLAKEKQRKKQRKEQADSELTEPGKETPNVEIDEDLGGTPKPAVPAKPAPLPIG
jgi:hypothetical protein